MNILVTGASGFLGNVLCRMLDQQGFNVTALALDATKANSLKDLNITKIDADIRDTPKINAALQGQDIVFHLASLIRITEDHDNSMHEINVEATKNLAEAALSLNIKRFIHVSTIHALYRFPQQEIVNENRELALSNDEFDYDRTKALGELAVLEIAKRGLNAIIVSPTCFIGPYDFEPSLMGDVLHKFFKQKIIMYLSKGGFNFLDVRDVAKTLINTIILGESGNRYIIGGEKKSVGELIDLVIAARKTSGIKLRVPTALALSTLKFQMLYWKLMKKKILYSTQSLRHLQFHQFIDDSKARKNLQHTSRPLTETFNDIHQWLSGAGNARILIDSN